MSWLGLAPLFAAFTIPVVIFVVIMALVGRIGARPLVIVFLAVGALWVLVAYVELNPFVPPPPADSTSAPESRWSVPVRAATMSA